MIYLRKAVPKDLAAMMDIIDDAKNLLKKDQIDQWQDGYPNLEQLQDDIDNNRAYVLVVNDQIVGMAAYFNTPDFNYDTLRNGHWHEEGPYATFHRLAVASDFRGQNLSSYLFSNLISLALSEGLTNIRIDTHQDNKRMQHIIANWGFEQRGLIQLQYPQGDVRVAYELNL